MLLKVVVDWRLLSLVNRWILGFMGTFSGDCKGFTRQLLAMCLKSHTVWIVSTFEFELTLLPLKVLYSFNMGSMNEICTLGMCISITVADAIHILMHSQRYNTLKIHIKHFHRMHTSESWLKVYVIWVLFAYFFVCFLNTMNSGIGPLLFCCTVLHI